MSPTTFNCDVDGLAAPREIEDSRGAGDELITQLEVATVRDIGIDRWGPRQDDDSLIGSGFEIRRRRRRFIIREIRLNVTLRAKFIRRAPFINTGVGFLDIDLRSEQWHCGIAGLLIFDFEPSCENLEQFPVPAEEIERDRR